MYTYSFVPMHEYIICHLQNASKYIYVWINIYPKFTRQFFALHVSCIAFTVTFAVIRSNKCWQTLYTTTKRIFKSRGTISHFRLFIAYKATFIRGIITVVRWSTISCFSAVNLNIFVYCSTCTRMYIVCSINTHKTLDNISLVRSLPPSCN